jgi:hypothetical protein
MSDMNRIKNHTCQANQIHLFLDPQSMLADLRHFLVTIFCRSHLHSAVSESDDQTGYAGIMHMHMGSTAAPVAVFVYLL